MSSQHTLLRKFHKILLKYNSENYYKLQDSLSKDKINKYMDQLGVDDEKFKSLFEWKNGFDFRTEGDTRTQIFDFGALLTLEYILESRELGSNFWVKTFIPLITTNEGDYLLFNNEKGKDYGKLHLYSVALLFIEEPISYFDSIDILIETTMVAYEKKILNYNVKDNWLERDVKSFRTLAKKYNPASDYWKENLYGQN